MPEQVSVDLAERSYEIYVGANLLEQAHTYIDPFLMRSRVAIINQQGTKTTKARSNFRRIWTYDIPL